MASLIQSAVCLGLQVIPVSIEAALGSGFSGVQLIGLPPDYAHDAKERIRAAVESLGFALPARRLVVSVRPSEVLKQFKGGLEHLDLPCAIAILAALNEQESNKRKKSESLSNLSAAISAEDHLFAGQLTLSGELLPPKQTLPFELLVLNQSSRIVNVWSAIEAQKISRAPHKNFKTVLSLGDCLRKLNASNEGRTHTKVNAHHPSESPSESSSASSSELNNENSAAFTPTPHPQSDCPNSLRQTERIFSQFLTNPVVGLALAVAAAGRHHILLAGSPGCGKTFALRLLKDLLPSLSAHEQLEVALIHQKDPSDFLNRPFRHPHHSASAAALLGGSLLQPGEVSLAHHGLLFLDELAEFPRPALEALREPLDERKITLSRARGRVELPARFLLAAATNPCLCGFFFSSNHSCRCLGNAPLKYQQKLSGPLLERFSILLLMDEFQENENAQNLKSSPLKELAETWAHAFKEDSARWIAHFQRVQTATWHPKQSIVSPESGAAPRLLAELDELAIQRKLSARTHHQLRELTKTCIRLFEAQAQHWNSQKFIRAVEQLRGFESALQKGVEFLTPKSI